MFQDPIVEEIHQARTDLLAKHQGNFEAYFASLMQTQRKHPERYVSFELQNLATQTSANPVLRVNNPPST
jgi:hypothetical protein